MLNEAMTFVSRNMKETTIIDKNTGKQTDKTEYPIIAIREIILNAIIHRDYSIHTDSTPITITMYNNRIEIENPGGLYGRITIAYLMSKYIHPMIDSGLIGLTIPEAPKSKKQKYYTI